MERWGQNVNRLENETRTKASCSLNKRGRENKNSLAPCTVLCGVIRNDLACWGRVFTHKALMIFPSTSRVWAFAMTASSSSRVSGSAKALGRNFASRLFSNTPCFFDSEVNSCLRFTRFAAISEALPPAASIPKDVRFEKKTLRFSSVLNKLFSEKSPGITKTLIYACGPCGPTSAKPSWLSLSLRCCCHDQPSLVGDPRSLDG